MTMQDTVFTIGHSTHSQERFIALLRQHGVTALCDVRSKPFSRLNPQFNLDELKKVLPEHGTKYLFLGKELGARSDDPACYERGKVQYDRLARTELFQQGLARIQDGMSKGFRIALMCAEKEPLECHRTILVARHLAALGIEVQHIHANGNLESHSDALHRLAQMVDVPEQDIFRRSPEELEDDAYRRQENRIAYELGRASALDAPPVSQKAAG
jgi:uncharacterized protein (DUF488 family)